jgi:alginate O-acetyltransferase complex protein AlgJ
MAMDSALIRHRLPQVAIILVFLLALSLPLLVWLFQKDLVYSEAEKRALLPLSGLTKQQSITEFTHAFDQYYQDHFGLREWFIHRYQREVSKRFGATGVADVVEGLENWLFFSSDYLLEDLEGKNHFSEKEVQLFWQKLQQKETWYRKRGIAYIYLITPDKQSIYSEYLPKVLQKAKKETRLDHLLAEKPAEEREVLLDIRARLLEAKADARLYDMTDTHWNHKGAYFAHQAIVERTRELFPDFQGRSVFHFATGLHYLPGGDLATMIGRSKSMPEGRPILETSGFSAVEKPLPRQLAELLTLPALRPQYSQNKNGQLRVLVLRDSFFNQLRPFVSETYGEVLYIWHYYETENLKELMSLYQPDLVIEEIVERHLHEFLYPSVEE